VSVSIPGGFRFRSPDFADAHAACAAFRALLAPLHARGLAALAARLVTETRDREAAALPPQAPSPGPRGWGEAMAEVARRGARVRETGRRDPAADFGFEVWILPARDAEGRPLLIGIASCDRPAWQRRWLAQPGVEDFAFWNGTDAPDGLADDEWEARGRVWRAALAGGGYRPAAAGAWRCELTEPFLAEAYPPRPGDIPARVLRAASGGGAWRRAAPLAEEAALGRATAGSPDPLRAFLDFRRALETPGSPEARLALAERRRIADLLDEDPLPALMGNRDALAPPFAPAAP